MPPFLQYSISWHNWLSTVFAGQEGIKADTSQEQAVGWDIIWKCTWICWLVHYMFLKCTYRSGTVKYPTSNGLTPKWGNFLIGFLIGAIRFLIISRQVGHRPNVGKLAGQCLEDWQKQLSVGQCAYDNHQPANPSECIIFSSDLLSQIRSTPIWRPKLSYLKCSTAADWRLV